MRDYVPQVAVLARTLARVRPGARLHVLCAGRESARTLRALPLEGVAVLELEQLEEMDPALLAAGRNRGPGEQCWTAKPALIAHLLARRDGRAVTYVDADIMFFSDPRPVLEEMRGASVALLPHRFASPFAGRERWAGAHNSAWITFVGDADGRAALGWWRERCLEWCRDRAEPGRFGDQLYLEELAARFSGVHLIRHPGAARAPWSDNRGLRREPHGEVTIDGRPLVAFHYQSLRIHASRGGGGLAWRLNRGYTPSPIERDVVYSPYLAELARAYRSVAEVDPTLVARHERYGAREATRELRQWAWMRLQEKPTAG